MFGEDLGTILAQVLLLWVSLRKNDHAEFYYILDELTIWSNNMVARLKPFAQFNRIKASAE